MGRRWIVVTAACATVACALGGVARADLHKDEQLGFSMQVPQGWRQIPIAAEEEFIVARYQSDREYADKKEGWTFRPELKVILFDPKGKKTAEVKEEGEGVSRITVRNPYRNFKEWVKSDGTGGRYISKEEETTVNGLPTTWYEVAYEKLTVPRHGVAFVYHAEDIDYCATMEVLEQDWSKLSQTLLQTLKSFKAFPRKGTVKRETTGDDVVLTADLSKLTPEERHKRRLTKFERDLEIAKSRLPDGWTVKRSKNYVAISHVDDKYTAKILDQAEAVRAWADATFSWWGDGIPGPQTLRICKDGDEERAFRDLSSRSAAWGTGEVTLAKDEGPSGFRWLAQTLFDRWLDEKSPQLATAQPPWLSQGIREWVGSAVPKGGKLEFRADADTAAALKIAAKQKKLLLPRELLLSTYDDLSARDKALQEGAGKDPTAADLAWRMSAWNQAAGFVRYLLAGPGKSNPRTKDLLPRYVAALKEHLAADEGKSSSSEAAPKTEEEEAERYKNRQSYWKEHQKEMLKAVFDKTFEEWTDADWSALDKSYAAFAG